jgi:hypothetical protein
LEEKELSYKTVVVTAKPKGKAPTVKNMSNINQY